MSTSPPDDESREIEFREALELTYEMIRHYARLLMRGERVSHTLPPTALAHEVFVQMLGADREIRRTPSGWILYLVTAMKNRLAGYARSSGAKKRGGGAERIPLNNEESAPGFDLDRAIDVRDSLEDLSRIDPEAAAVAELWFLGGSTCREAAETLGIAIHQARSAWERAKVWLLRRFSEES